MNEKIKELVEQANISDIIDDAYIERGVWKPFIEQFAKLILLECIGICDEVQENSTVKIKIKERFGVE